MNDSTNIKRAMTIIRRIARIWSIVILALFLVLIIGHSLNPEEPSPTPIEWVGMAFFPIGVVIGLILAWKWEGLGGIITIVCVLVFYVWVQIVKGRSGGPVPALVGVPSVLFLIYWLRSRSQMKAEGTG